MRPPCVTAFWKFVERECLLLEALIDSAVQAALYAPTDTEL